jgi:hypothetical protein
MMPSRFVVGGGQPLESIKEHLDEDKSPSGSAVPSNLKNNEGQSKGDSSLYVKDQTIRMSNEFDIDTPKYDVEVS